MNTNFIGEKISNFLKAFPTSDAIVVIKGVSLEYLSQSVLEMFLEFDILSDKKIDELQLFSKKKRDTIKRKLIAGFENPVLMTFETFLFFSNILKDEDLVESSIYLLDFSLLSYQKSNLLHFSFDIEEISEYGESFDILLYNKMFANSVILDNEVFVQYIEVDSNLLKKVEVFKLIAQQNFFFENIDVINEDDLTENDLIYNYENRKYLNLIERVYANNISQVSMIIDNETIQEELSRLEFQKVFSILQAFNVKVTVKKLQHNLTKNTRPELLELLNSYWKRPGKESSFNKLKVYLDPDISKETIEISQGDVVENIIQQYENGFNNVKAVRDVFLTAPTGAGKSLLFQMPAMYIGEKYNALSIVVSPLKALMVDQVRQLKEDKGFTKVAYINSDITLIQREEVIADIGAGKIDMVYLAPELLLSYDITYFLNGRCLGLYIVDEAHTVSTWGRDFRIDYWYLGYHINRVRKYALDSKGNKLKFPVIAVTATAPYGNIHDVAFETMSSLQMNAPIKYIGYAKRDDITFNINHVEIQGNLQTQKINLAVKRIQDFENNAEKTIIYCPFTTQVNALVTQARKENLNIYPYHGSMNVDEQKESYTAFTEQSPITMAATKAFGMGVDINDVSTVYHMAPTGLLTDYIQEVGRAARKENVIGKAVLDYSSRDFQFINQLHGLGRMHNWQLREVMRRLVRLYNDTNEQNHLLSTEDFSHIFGNTSADQLQNNVKKALLLIEKDLNRKFSRIPVIIARPKNMFSTVFASISNVDFSMFLRKYGNNNVYVIPYFRIAHLDRVIIKIELDKIWEDYFRDKSFGIVKKEFYSEKIFKGLRVIPKLRITLEIKTSIQNVLQSLNQNFERIEFSLQSLQGTFFSNKQFAYQLINYGMKAQIAHRMADLILPIFSQQEDYSNLSADDVRANSNFLQSRRMNGETEIKYRLVDTAIGSLRSNIRRTINEIFINEKVKVELFVSTDSAEKKLYIKIGQLLDIFELGQFEVTGGENPRMFVRINDPFRLKMEAFSNYENQLINDVRNRHNSGVELMKAFFESKMESGERWDFIEDFLLGRKA